MAHKIDENKPVMQTRQMFGRRVIKTSVSEITENNITDVLRKAVNVHSMNSSEIDYLWNYYKGKQPILNRVKEVRPEIMNTIVENRANEIVSFWVGYLLGDPIQYVGRNGSDEITESIMKLNELMFSEGKSELDRDMVEWLLICGTAYRLVLPDDKETEADEAPFEMFTLDPRSTFVVYSTDVSARPLMGVSYTKDDNEITKYTVYTDTMTYQIHDDILVNSTPHVLGMVPIFEYPANNARLGAFEIVLPLLDTMNNITSNRMDGVEQVVQAFIKFINCDISLEEYQEFLKLGAIKVKSSDGLNADVDVVTCELNQTQAQILKEDCYNSVLTICGIPNRNGGSSTSDTGAAVVLRDGWSLAETRAKDIENMFKRSEKRMLRLVLKICHDLSDFVLNLKDIELQFTRRNYENIQSKAQVLVQMLESDKIHPLLAFQHSNLFIDPERAYSMSVKYMEEEQAKAIELNRQMMESQTENNNEDDLNGGNTNRSNNVSEKTQK